MADFFTYYVIRTAMPVAKKVWGWNIVDEVDGLGDWLQLMSQNGRWLSRWIMNTMLQLQPFWKIDDSNFKNSGFCSGYTSFRGFCCGGN